MQIKHLSITASNPERAAGILAELTDGSVYPFTSKTMEGAWVCAWDRQSGEMIEFIPNNYLLCPGKHAAEFRPAEEVQNFNSTHFLLETRNSLDHLKAVAESHGLHHRFRPRLGGPLYEVWLETQILVEFVSDESGTWRPDVNFAS